MKTCTRRSFLRSATAASLLAGFTEEAWSNDDLSWADADRLDAGSERRYRADAVVLIFSVPLFHRRGVGGGSVRWRQSAPQNGNFIRLLEFTGYSDPKRAAGLNRLGLIRELVQISGGQLSSALYFGLMTSSPEESTEEARKALHSDATSAAYSVIDGRIGQEGSTSTGAHFVASSRLSMAHRGELEELARKALATAPIRTTMRAGGGALPPFLEKLAELLAAPVPNQGQYLYNGHIYQLRLERTPDATATQYFRERRMTSSDVIRATGKLRRESGGKQSQFRVWVEKGARHPLPLRIEYEPKSYLRLVFEAEPGR